VQYATKIARDWNVPASGSGYVTRFAVRKFLLDNYQVHQVGGHFVLEHWIPAEDLPALNASIAGLIEVVAEYPLAEPAAQQMRTFLVTL
jgi:hypothetical protein